MFNKRLRNIYLSMILSFVLCAWVIAKNRCNPYRLHVVKHRLQIGAPNPNPKWPKVPDDTFDKASYGEGSLR